VEEFLTVVEKLVDGQKGTFLFLPSLAKEIFPFTCYNDTCSCKSVLERK